MIYLYRFKSTLSTVVERIQQEVQELFVNKEAIDERRAELERMLQEIRTSNKPHAVKDREVEAILPQTKNLDGIESIGKMLDTGEADEVIARVKSKCGLIAVEGCLDKYTTVKAAEVFLAQHPSLHREPALYFVYEGSFGTVCCVHGMRVHVNTIYALAEDKEALLSSKDLLVAYLVRPMSLGPGSPYFRSAPVGMIETSHDKLISKVSKHIAPATSKQDWYLPDGSKDYHLIFSLVRDDWDNPTRG